MSVESDFILNMQNLYNIGFQLVGLMLYLFNSQDYCENRTYCLPL